MAETTPIQALNLPEARMSFLVTMVHYESLKFKLRNNSHMIKVMSDTEIKDLYDEITITIKNLELLAERVEDLSS